jgi:hypothetical protein
MSMMRARSGVWAAAPAGVLLWAAAAGPGAAQTGGFEACLNGQAKQWIDARAELVLNEDPAASAIDDAAVAAWTARTLEGCKAKAGRSDQESERLFARYMAHWREHIDAAVTEVRKRSRPD